MLSIDKLNAWVETHFTPEQLAVVVLLRRRRPCRDLDAFWTGDLGKRAAERFRAHLVDCPDCMGWIVLWGQLGDEHHDTTPGGRPGER